MSMERDCFWPGERLIFCILARPSLGRISSNRRPGGRVMGGLEASAGRLKF